MTFIEGTITSEANPAAKLYTDYIDGALSSAGFTLVDTVTIGARTHKVWKSDAGDNVAGLDWYLDIAYTTTGAGSVWLIPFEHYEPSTDLGYRGPMGAPSTGTIAGAFYTIYEGTGQALETNWSPRAGDTNYLLPTNTSSFYFALSITPDRVIALSSQAPTNVLYTGLYEPDPNVAAHAGADLFPLWTGVIVASGSNYGALCRVPKVTGNYVTSRFAVPRNLQATLRTPAIPSGPTNIYGAGALIPIPISTDSNTGVDAIWGYPYDLRAGIGSASVVRGDTVTIAADDWVLTSYHASGIFGFKAV